MASQRRTVKRSICCPILTALSFLLLQLSLSGCWFFIGDASVYSGIEAYAPHQSKEASVRVLDDAMTAAGFRRIRGFPAGVDEVHTGTEIRITCGHAGIDAMLADYRRGSTVCVSVQAFPATEFDPETKAGIARLKAVLIERFGDKNVAAVACYGNTLYWPE